jgi:hypothetical protein
MDFQLYILSFIEHSVCHEFSAAYSPFSQRHHVGCLVSASQTHLSNTSQEEAKKWADCVGL